jgi:hypothetical protein
VGALDVRSSVLFLEAIMKSVRCVAAFVLSIMSCGLSAQTARDADRVQEDVRTMVYALHDGDVDTVLRFTAPRVIEQSGGPENVRRALRAAAQLSQQSGMQIESFRFPEAPAFVEGGGRRFALVPTLQVVSARGQKVESLNFQLGILEPGAQHWVYVEGSRLTPQNIQAVAPGFPVDYELPPFYRRRL